MLCRRCREVETENSPPPGSSRTAGPGHSRGGARFCARCGVPLTEEEQDDFLSRMLKKFGLLGEAGTVLERREKGL